MAKLNDRYANALLELSEEKDTLEEDLEQIVLVRDALNEEKVQAFLLHPHIFNSDKREFFQNVFSNKISDHLMGFLYLVVRKNREGLILPVLSQYIERANRRLGRIEAKVVSAKALSKEQIESIHIALSKKLNMQIKMKTFVDPDVIGGFYILVDGHIFDGTVRSKLNNMRKQLKGGLMDDSKSR